MTLLADESVDYPIVERLRLDGHAVDSIQEISPSISDAEVLARSRTGNRILLTADKDFGEMVYRQKLVHGGVILVRLAGLDEKTKIEIVSNAIRDHVAEMADAFTAVSPGGIRIRKVS